MGSAQKGKAAGLEQSVPSLPVALMTRQSRVVTELPGAASRASPIASRLQGLYPSDRSSAPE